MPDAFSWENDQTDEELLAEPHEGEPEPTPSELAEKMDAIFGPAPTMGGQPDPRRKIANPLIAAIKERSAFDLANEFSVEDLIAFRDLNGDSGTDLVKLNNWTKADLAASIATRLATRAEAPSQEELESQMSPVSEALIDLSDKQFERLVQDTLSGGGGGYGQGPELKRLRRMMKEQREES